MDSVFQFQESVGNKISKLESLAAVNVQANSSLTASNPTNKFQAVGMSLLFASCLQPYWLMPSDLDSLQKLQSENLKLRYQIDFLKANIANVSAQAQGNF